jgi:hypothetical protein
LPITYDNIATTTLGSATNIITFNSIPATYTDLRVVFVGVGTAGGVDCLLRCNNDSVSVYSVTYLDGNGTTATSNRYSSSPGFNANYAGGLSTTIPTLITFDLFSYAGSTFKACLNTTQADRNGSGFISSQAGFYPSTSAITRLDLVAASSTFTAGSTATLYGIKNA